MNKIFKILSLMAALAFGAQAAQAGECCKPGAKCCKPEAPCCKK